MRFEAGFHETYLSNWRLPDNPEWESIMLPNDEDGVAMVQSLRFGDGEEDRARNLNQPTGSNHD